MHALLLNRMHIMLNARSVMKKNAHYAEIVNCRMHTLFLPLLWQTDEKSYTFLQTGPKRRQFLIYSCCTEYTSVADLSYIFYSEFILLKFRLQYFVVFQVFCFLFKIC